MKITIGCVLVLFYIPILLFGQTSSQFKHPADEYRPWIFWDWVNDMVSNKGITADLEQFKKFGLNGTLIMLVGSETSDRQMWAHHNMPNPVVSQTPEFFNTWKFAAEESARLGLTISSQLGPGWCHSGGPWVKPEQAVQHIAGTETEIISDQSKKIKLVLGGAGEIVEGFGYHSDMNIEDTPHWISMELAKPAIIEKIVLHPVNNKGILDFGFPKQFVIEVADKADFLDSRVFYKTSKDFPLPVNEPAVLTGKQKGKYIRIKTIKNYSTERAGKTIYLLSLSKIDVIENGLNMTPDSKLSASSSIENFPWSIKPLNSSYNAISFVQPGNRYVLERPGAQYFTSDVAVVAYPVKPVVKPEEVIDLTSKFVNGQLSLQLPLGKWKIKRFAMRNALAYNRPAPVGGKGLESDKLDKGAVDAMFSSMVGRYLRESPNLRGKTIRAFEADSWEVGNPEWSAKFKDEFSKRRGYNPTPWLISYKTGKIVGSKKLTERFKADMYLTQTDLFADNFFSHLADKADSLGMEFMTEPYVAPFDPVRMAGRVQVPMCEFWVSTEMMFTARWASSAANTYGRKKVAAEAFTGRWNDGNWTMDPYAIKRVGDLAFCNGVNAMVLHGTALQPWGMDHKPGMNMFFWGTQFVPGQTWWAPGRAWVDYLSRCQYMLRQGYNVADIAGLMPNVDWHDKMPQGLHKKYNYDLITEELLVSQMDFKNGFFTLPSGARYRVFFLPKTGGKMEPAVLSKLIELVKKGGTIVCEDKPSMAPGLRNYPQSDNTVKALVEQLWGKTDGIAIKENKLGKGKLIWLSSVWKNTFDPERQYFLDTRTIGAEFWGNSAETTSWSDEFMEVLRQFALPDVEVLQASGTAMAWGGKSMTTTGKREKENAVAWIHRKKESKDFYFVCSQVADATNAEVLFRVTNKIPFIMDPATGENYRIRDWSDDGKRTRIILPFDPFGSVFIVFVDKDQLPATKGIYNSLAETQTVPLNMTWEVSFPKGYGAPEKASLQTGSWTNSNVFGIKYFSGTATYQANLEITTKQLQSGTVLDLGEVKNLAEVIMNGKVVDTLWKPPFKTDISKFLKVGNNQLVIKITNTWWNRMVGDEQLPEDLEWLPNNRYAGNDYRGYELKHFPNWIWTNTQRPSKGRVTFTPWKFVEKDSKLESAGLIGPVRLLLY
ncbi:glycosyl hydrolase [Pedobacter heparinus]|uniref:glycosyl hydrolase n=1 Tax=Pedobacter heparinus TaxID=984 RepID=UPI002930B6C4|nr:glycosyl hydrolase [Pedobacter heparinus]